MKKLFFSKIRQFQCNNSYNSYLIFNWILKINFLNEVSKKNIIFKTPFYFAIEVGNSEIIQLLLDDPKIDLKVKLIFFYIFFI